MGVQLSAIRTIWDKFCFKDATLGLETPRKKRKRPVILSREEVRRLLEACPSTRDTRYAADRIDVRNGHASQRGVPRALERHRCRPLPNFHSSREGKCGSTRSTAPRIPKSISTASASTTTRIYLPIRKPFPQRLRSAPQSANRPAPRANGLPDCGDQQTHHTSFPEARIRNPLIRKRLRHSPDSKGARTRTPGNDHHLRYCRHRAHRPLEPTGPTDPKSLDGIGPPSQSAR